MKQRVTRSELRGKPLDSDCMRYAKSDSGQYGQEDKRCYCTGIWNVMFEDVERKCVVCNAWNSNAKPYK